MAHHWRISQSKDGLPQLFLTCPLLPTEGLIPQTAPDSLPMLREFRTLTGTHE